MIEGVDYVVQHMPSLWQRLKGERPKYLLLKTQCYETGIKGDFVLFNHCAHRAGIMLCHPGLTWDGATGGIDRFPWEKESAWMAASLPHDMFCVAIYPKKLISPSVQPMADKLMYNLCIKHGMWKLRAWISYRVVRAYQRVNRRKQIEQGLIKDR